MSSKLFPLYTLGYTGLKPDEILKAAKALNAIIADIRIAPRSRHPMWNQAKMIAAWQERYLHIPALGNRNYKGQYGEGVMLTDAEAGSAEVTRLLEAQPVILLCACADWHTCHRRTAAEVIQTKTGVEVIHLSIAEVHRFNTPDEPQQLSLM
jgi:uncharacterized protein (DUF488 family)